ncbi:ABC transporter substrate-binding protein [Mucilaginibacter sp.]|uniref:ABC transporter substrate-binding protein n=1 Tax=Mucilaginibacter sp. TaxID=1882438 RepID=UPI0035BC47A3
MPLFHDQMKRVVNLTGMPKRIVSIVPSQTELLFELGLDTEIAGITKFCIHPKEKISRATKIGGTKQLNMELIAQLKPDLIIANKEENEQSQVEELMKHYPVWISDINNLQTALDMIASVGKMVGRQLEAFDLADQIKRRFDLLIPFQTRLRVAYLIWRKPYMVAGNDTFIDSMLLLCGFTNAVNQSRYPELDANKIIDLQPDVLLLSSEPYPFSQKHIHEFEQLLPRAQIMLVDGEMFSWYGSRLLHAPAYFNSLINNLNKITPK